VAHGENIIRLENISFPKTQGMSGWCVQNKQSTIVYDVSKDRRFHEKEKINVRSLISCPLIYRDEVLGVIQVMNKNKNTDKNEYSNFSDSDKNFLEDFSTNIGLHLKTSRIVREHDKLQIRMDSFTKLHKLLSSTMDLNKLLPTVLANAIKLSNAEVGSIWLVEDNGEGVECRYAYGPTRDQVTGLKLKNGVGVIGKVVTSQTPIMIEDCAND
jgi:GAF domain-containing protein